MLALLILLHARMPDGLCGCACVRWHLQLPRPLLAFALLSMLVRYRVGILCHEAALRSARTGTRRRRSLVTVSS